jgi:hypothetical protein
VEPARGGDRPRGAGPAAGERPGHLTPPPPLRSEQQLHSESNQARLAVGEDRLVVAPRGAVIQRQELPGAFDDAVAVQVSVGPIARRLEGDRLRMRVVGGCPRRRRGLVTGLPGVASDRRFPD